MQEVISKGGSNPEAYRLGAMVVLFRRRFAKSSSCCLPFFNRSPLLSFMLVPHILILIGLRVVVRSQKCESVYLRTFPSYRDPVAADLDAVEGARARQWMASVPATYTDRDRYPASVAAPVEAPPLLVAAE